MVILRRKKRDIPRAGPYAPGWDVPAQFNFTRDVVEALAIDPTRPALTFVDHEGIVDRRTFHEIAGDAARWAHLLRTRLDRGDRVLVVLGKVPAWHGAMLGALKGGVVAVPCSDMLRARDLAFRVQHSGARLVIADRACEAEVEEMVNKVGSVSVLYLDEALAELSRYMPVAPTEDTTAGETALILYTSGTTKDPKGVVHTHGYTWANRMQATHWLDAHERDVVWCTAGTGWAKAAWNVLLGPWSHGAEVVLHQGPFDPEERLALLQRLGVTILCQAPTEYRMLAKLEALGTVHLPRLRHAVSAGEPLNPEVIARFQDALGLTVHDGYGQTENSLLVANSPGAPIRPGSMGLPTPGHDVAVIDDAGHVCAPGVEGDLALIGRPPTLFTGYYDDRDATESAFRDGWYITGDRAMRDEQGYLWFVGRADDVILSSAYRIGPFEVESALLEHPAVAESAVVGVPDVDRGQIVKAFVVLRDGHEPGDELASELQEHVKAVTAPYKYPRAVAFVEELPKTASGKVRRSELRELDAQGLVNGVVAVPTGPTPEMRERAAIDAQEAARLEAEEAARLEAEERARRAAAAERARAESAAAAAAAATQREAEAAERAKAEAEAAAARREAVEAARREAEEAQRLSAEAEEAEAERLRAEAEETARLRAEAEEAERLRAEAEAAEHARREAEEAERLRAEAEAAEQARREAEEADRLRAEAEAAEQARREAEEAERLRAEAEEAERLRVEAEEAERLRAEAEAAEQARLEAEAAEVERLRAEAEAAARRAAEEQAARREAEAAERARAEAEEAARLEAEEAARREAEEAQRLREEAEAAERARAEAEEAERLRAEAEALALAEASVVETEPGTKESRWEARRRRREEAEIAKQAAAEAKRIAKEEEEQRKRYAADARADAIRREAEEKELAKRRAEEEKAAARRREEEAKVAAKQREEEEKRRKIDEQVAERRRAEEERRRAKEEAKARRKGLGRLLHGEPDEFDMDDAPTEPIPDIVARLQRYSGTQEPEPEPTPQAERGDETPTQT